MGVVVVVVVVSSVVAPEELELLDESSFAEQEMTVRLKRNMEKMMSICLTRFPIGGVVERNNITSIGLFYKEVGILLEGGV